MARWMTIGALARATGIPVKTIRHYSDEGVLPPAGRSTSRYRLYRDTDRGRLELIRVLRSLDVDLATIRAVMTQRQPIRDGFATHLAMIDARLRALTRARAVLARAAQMPTDEAAVDAFSRLQAGAVLDGAERNPVLPATMERHLKGVPADAAWQARLWEIAFKDLPENLSNEQWSALVELIDLVQNEDFGRRLAEQGRAYWSKAKSGGAATRPRLRRVILVAARFADRGEPPTSTRARRLIRQFVSLSAAAAGRRPTRAFERWLLAQADRHDPRSERFWVLVGLVRGWPPAPRPEPRAYRWLFGALAHTRVSAPTRFANS
jgi:DNA-binding transcriptional MerR regulator